MKSIYSRKVIFVIIFAMKHFLAVLLIPILYCTSLFGDNLGLAELIDIALKNNPETARVWSNIKQAQATVGIAKSKMYPHLDGSGQVAHAREVKYPNGPNTTYSFYSAELSLNYLLFDFGELSATVRATKEALQAARWWSDFTMQKIIAEVSSNYYEYLNATEIVKNVESSLRDAEMILSSAEELYKAGLRSQSDSITAKATVAKTQMSLAQKKANCAIAMGKLLTTLSLPIGTELEVQASPEVMKESLFKEGTSALISLAEEQRADLLSKKSTLDEMKARVDRAKRAPYPKFKFLGQAGWLEYAKHQGKGYNYSAGIGMELPLFKGFEYTYQIRHAAALADVTSAELKELQNEIALEVLMYSERVKASLEVIHHSEDFFSEALISYEGAMESYKAGLINIFDLLQTQAVLSSARIDKAQARTEWLVSTAQLAFATGSLCR